MAGLLMLLLIGLALGGALTLAYRQGRRDADLDQDSVILRRGETLLLWRTVVRVTGFDTDYQGNKILHVQSVRDLADAEF